MKGEGVQKSRYVLIGCVIVLILAAGVLILKKNHKHQQVKPESASAGGRSLGPVDAPVHLIEYSDFQCPACRMAEPFIQKILNDPEYKGKIRFTYKHFPLSGHQWSGPAHQAAECANRAGKFWQFHDKLYEEQQKWSAMSNPIEAFLTYAKDLHLPGESFILCLANPQVQAEIVEEKNEGMDLQIRSTPTFFIGDERYVGPFELENRGRKKIREILGLPPLVPAVSTSLVPEHLTSANAAAALLQTPVSGTPSPAPSAAPAGK